MLLTSVRRPSQFFILRDFYLLACCWLFPLDTFCQFGQRSSLKSVSLVFVLFGVFREPKARKKTIFDLIFPLSSMACCLIVCAIQSVWQFCMKTEFLGLPNKIPTTTYELWLTDFIGTQRPEYRKVCAHCFSSAQSKFNDTFHGLMVCFFCLTRIIPNRYRVVKEWKNLSRWDTLSVVIHIMTT